MNKEGSLILCEVPKDSRWGRLYEQKRKDHRFYRYAKLYTLTDICKILRGVDFHITEATATLSYDPDEDEEVEAPATNVEGKSFVCIRALRSV